MVVAAMVAQVAVVRAPDPDLAPEAADPEALLLVAVPHESVAPNAAPLTAMTSSKLSASIWVR